MKETRLIESHNGFDLVEIYKGGKFLYKTCVNTLRKGRDPRSPLPEKKNDPNTQAVKTAIQRKESGPGFPKQIYLEDGRCVSLKRACEIEGMPYPQINRRCSFYSESYEEAKEWYIAKRDLCKQITKHLDRMCSEELAEFLGIKIESLYRIENATTKLPIETLKELAYRLTN